MSQISTFVFATYIVQSRYFQNPKFQTSSHLQCLFMYSLVCVGPCRKPEDRSSYDGSHYLYAASRKIQVLMKVVRFMVEIFLEFS